MIEDLTHSFLAGGVNGFLWHSQQVRFSFLDSAALLERSLGGAFIISYARSYIHPHVKHQEMCLTLSQILTTYHQEIKPCPLGFLNTVYLKCKNNLIWDKSSSFITLAAWKEILKMWPELSTTRLIHCNYGNKIKSIKPTIYLPPIQILAIV